MIIIYMHRNCLCQVITIMATSSIGKPTTIKFWDLNNSTVLFRFCLSYVYEQLLQSDIDAFVSDWNMHVIRKNRFSCGPSGRPDDMFDMPKHFGKVQYNIVLLY